MPATTRRALTLALFTFSFATTAAAQPAPMDPNTGEVPPEMPAPPPEVPEEAPPSVVPGAPQVHQEPVAQAPLPLPPAARPEPPDPDARRHDGFYARFGAGFAAYRQTFQSEDVDPNGEVKGTLTGVASVSEFAVGGTIGTGFVLGIGTYGANILASNYHQESGGPLPIDFGDGEFSYNLIGPFFDYYFDERKGLHLQGALGFAYLSGIGVGATSYDEDQYTALGGGAMVGIGHDWWVADSWGVGLVGRAMLGVVTGKDDADVRWLHIVATGPSILFTVTYH